MLNKYRMIKTEKKKVDERKVIIKKKIAQHSKTTGKAEKDEWKKGILELMHTKREQKCIEAKQKREKRACEWRRRMRIRKT